MKIASPPPWSRTRRILWAAQLAVGLFTATAMRGEICTIDDVPSATLLLPYFEVGLDDASQTTTLFSINNAAADAVLAHVVLWTDLAVPTLRFDVYLTGFDVVTINLRDIFVEGRLPETLGGVPEEARERGIRGGPSVADLTSCRGRTPAALEQAYTNELRKIHTGQASMMLGDVATGAHRCGARSLGDDIARGYVSVDAVRRCSALVPGDPGYFVAGGRGVATNQNVLWGDWFIVDNAQVSGFGDTLVGLEAVPGTRHNALPYPGVRDTMMAGEYTFYGRYVGWSAEDNREPLPGSFATRFLNGGASAARTDFIVWRDSKVQAEPFPCPAKIGSPAWYPLEYEEIVRFDEQEQLDSTIFCPITCEPGARPPAPLPAASQRVDGLSNFLLIPHYMPYGWVFLNLNHYSSVAGTVPPEDPLAAQAWVTAVHQTAGRYTIGVNAVQMANGCAGSHER